ncbi:MAG: hypothetical protein NT150_08840 [Bacteroidetes bacterium]|nr:hypothetical protein [Bacteroidota bacterium]
MRKFEALLILFLLSALFSNAQDKLNLNGLWQDSCGTSFSNCYAIISQQGNSISFSHYLEFEGQSFVETGKGKLKGRTIVYSVKVTLEINGWATEGVHELTLSEDGKTLRGSFKDNKGNSGPIVLKRISS